MPHKRHLFMLLREIDESKPMEAILSIVSAYEGAMPEGELISLHRSRCFACAVQTWTGVLSAGTFELGVERINQQLLLREQ